MAAKIVNIRRDVDDKFYRYRMPLLLTKIEGKGNGIKTVVPNMSDVARALSRPPTYPTKFFGCELGAQTSFDEKNDRYIVNGAHDAPRLRELLDAFIDKFVLCGSCKNPETDLIIMKNDDILRDCKACGQRSAVDMRHRLTTFILKNPPKVAKKAKGKKGDAGNGAAGGVGGGAAGDEEGDGGADSDDELTKRIKAEAAELNTKSELKADEWSADTSAEAVAARQAELAGAVGKLTVGGDDDGGSDEDVDSPQGQLKIWILENRETATAVEVYKKVEDIGIEKKHKTTQTLMRNLFTENAVAEFTKWGPLLTKMVTSEKHQKALLGGLEQLAGIDYPDLIPQVSKILMLFYQADLLEEEILKQWGTHVSKKYTDKETSKKVRKSGEPFLKWLDEADESDSEEDDD